MSAPGVKDPPAAGRIDVGSLLTIDVDAEIRKVAQAQLNGPWQLPAELVRRTCPGGASRVDVTLGRTLVVHDDGDPLDDQKVSALAFLLDDTSPPERRHAALLRLEDGDMPLVALAGAGASRILMESYDWREQPVYGYRLEWNRGQRPRVWRLPKPGRGTRFEIEGVSIDRKRAYAWLESVCRFTPQKVLVEGRALPRGFEGALCEKPLKPEELLVGDLALPREGDRAHVWLLLDGLVSAHLTLSKFPCFEAAIEMREIFWHLGREPTGLADLRDAMVDQLHHLLAAVKAFLLEQAKRIQTLAPAEARRVRELMITLVRHSETSVPEFFEARIFRDLPRKDAPERWLNLQELAAVWSKANGLWAIAPGDDPARYVLPAEPVLVMDSAERTLLTQAMAFNFRAPPLRPEARGLAGKLAEALSDGLFALRHWVRRLRFGAVTPLPPEALSPAERGFAEALARQLQSDGAPAEVRLCAGHGPIRRLGRTPRWLLPRENPTVVASVRAWSADPAWIYPAAIAILDGKGLPDSDASEVWRGR